MLENNNRSVISDMAVRIIRRNKRRYGVIVTAVALASFMVFTVLNAGGTYFNMRRVQDLRTGGADHDAVIVGGVSEELKERCKERPEIADAGISAYAGYAVPNDNKRAVRAGLVWCDEEYWEQLKRPALGRMEGNYPQKVHELMINTDILEECGLGRLKTGDSFTFTYENMKGIYSKEFTISGTYSDYSDEKIFYVSEAFYRQTGYKLDYDGMLFLKFSHPILFGDTLDKMEEDLMLGKRQALFMTANTEQAAGILFGLVSIVLFTCLSAGLLIYNILYLSVSGNIRYYGLMHTLGMTEGQIHLLLKKQILYTGAAGITCGILLGAGGSSLLIPGVVRALGIREKNIQAACHPAVLLITILLAGLTLYLGSRKAVKTASTVGEVEALGGHRFGSVKPGSRWRGGGGRHLLWRLAWRQFSSDKKKTAVVILSLAAGLSVFLCMTVLTDSHGPRNVAPNYMDADMEIRNDTLYAEEEEQWTQIMDASFIESLEKDEGIAEIHTLLEAKIIVPWEPQFSDLWMREYYDMWVYYQTYDEIIEEYKQNPQDFYSFVKGIDEAEFGYINAGQDTPVDKEAFMEGKVCLIYRNGLSFGQDALKGKSVTYKLEGETEDSYRMPIAGLVDDGYYGGSEGRAPVVIVSDTFLRQITDDPYVCKINIRYRDGYEAKTERKIKEVIAKSPYAAEFSYDSKMESIQKAEKSQGSIRIVGAGITLILASIGLMNYVNTVAANIQNRQTVFDIMQHVGMTGKQLRNMLITEGVLFAAGALLTASTAGTAVTYLIYQSMNYMDYPFQIPLLPAAAAAVVSLLLCIVVPLVFCRILDKEKEIRQYQ